MRHHHKDGASKASSFAMFDYLSVIILGFIDTRSVFVPTSAEYFSLMGGMLHLHRERVSAKSPNVSQILDPTFERTYLNTKSAESISFPHLLFLMMPPFPTTAHFLNCDLE